MSNQQSRFAEGYQAALTDVLEAARAQGLTGVLQWLTDNIANPADRLAAVDALKDESGDLP